VTRKQQTEKPRPQTKEPRRKERGFRARIHRRGEWYIAKSGGGRQTSERSTAEDGGNFAARKPLLELLGVKVPGLEDPGLDVCLDRDEALINSPLAPTTPLTPEPPGY
jgi:hypothetical protein